MPNSRLSPLPTRRLAVAMGAVLAAVAIAASASASHDRAVAEPTAACTADPAWAPLREDLAARVLEAVNAHRAALGLARLALSPQLQASAAWKARHTATYGYLDVDDPAPPVRRTFLERLTSCGYGGLIASETLAQAFPDADSVVAAWLGDPETRATIEHPRFTATGVAVATAANGDLYWIEDFGVAAAPPQVDSRCHVPSVVGRTLASAGAALRRSGCRVGTVVRVRWRHARRGRVLAQAPQPGRTLKPRARVDLVVSNGSRRP
jgi:uncharacterized protein YkwD